MRAGIQDLVHQPQEVLDTKFLIWTNCRVVRFFPFFFFLTFIAFLEELWSGYNERHRFWLCLLHGFVHHVPGRAAQRGGARSPGGHARVAWDLCRRATRAFKRRWERDMGPWLHTDIPGTMATDGG